MNTWSLLQPNNLPIRKFAPVMDQVHCTDSITNVARAAFWFGDSAAVDFYLNRMRAVQATEETYSYGG